MNQVLAFPAGVSPASAIDAADVRIESMAITNFKGCRNFGLALRGRSASIFGANERGKTTLADAWAWLLTGKDSQGRADFEVKTLASSGEAIHNLTHEVGARLIVRGERVVLLRTLTEKWTKRRGSHSAEFSGHTTTFAINGVPVQEKEWKDRIAVALAPERTLLLLSDPAYFSERLHWQERRKLLLEVCGDIADADVIASDPDLARLPAILGHYSMDDFRAIAMASLKKANAELVQLPARLDEAQRSLSELGEVDEDALTALLGAAQAVLKRAREDEAAILSGGDAAATRAALLSAETELRRLQADREAVDRFDAQKRNRARADAEDALRLAERKLAASAPERERLTASIAKIDADIIALRSEWAKVSASPLNVSPVADACAACGQALPAEKVEAARERAQAHANLARAEALRSIQDCGRQRAQTLGGERERLAMCEAEAASCQQRVDAARAALDEAVAASGSASPAPASGKEHGAQAEVDRLKALLGDGDAMRTEQAANASGIREAAEKQLGALQQRQATLAADARTRERVADLEAKQRELCATVERLQGEIALCDHFVVTKVDLMEARINQRFGVARFRMCERQINGGVNECCDVTYRGVPYADLNHAAKVNVGLDCIRVLQEHFGVRLPVWVDGRESVTTLAPTGAQTISLVVSPRDLVLRVELEEA